jgi:hypothetical protein
MTSHTMTSIAAPAWGGSAGEALPAAAPEPRPAWPVLVAPRRPLELRVRRPRLGAAAIGVAIAAGFTLLWVFLLLGVVAPAGTLG